MGPPSYMRFVVKRNVVMWLVPVFLRFDQSYGYLLPSVCINTLTDRMAIES